MKESTKTVKTEIVTLYTQMRNAKRETRNSHNYANWRKFLFLSDDKTRTLRRIAETSTARKIIEKYSNRLQENTKLMYQMYH